MSGINKKITIPWKTALFMVASYAGVKLKEQVRSVAFIVIYLFLFQVVILGEPVPNALQVIGGILFVIIGLTLFMEGLIVGLMPLGERVGLQLPKHSRLSQLALFGVLVGFVATLAEPAVNALQAARSDIAAWEAPLLYMLLETHSGLLIAAIGGGVGLAVALSMLRYSFGLSLKPFLLFALPFILVLSAVLTFGETTKAVVGLAWDTGAVTTGPVTVPIVLALGLGISRAAGKQELGAGGFGSIALASLFPVLGVLLLGLGLSFSAPAPSSEVQFFSQEHRESAVRVIGSNDALEQYAFTRGSMSSRKAFYGNQEEYREAVASLAEDTSLLGSIRLSTWVNTRASDDEVDLLQSKGVSLSSQGETHQVPTEEVMGEEAGSGLRAVLPLTGLLLFVLVVILRERLKYTDEFILGIVLTLCGMILLTSGIRLGLSPLGDTVGRQLPRVYQAEEQVEVLSIENFDMDLVYEGIDTDGKRYSYFFLRHDGDIQTVEFDKTSYDPQKQVYMHTRKTTPIFGSDLTFAGIILVLLFAFGLGFGTTQAEPALHALGRSVEETTVGTIRQRGIIRAVSLGVGTGVVLGVIRIMYAFPILWLLLPAYLLLIPLTLLSKEEITGISWDSGGVTTGPVTVPLVMAMGLGIGGALDIVDGFGILALASVCPIIFVQLYGFIIRARQRFTMRAVEMEAKDG